MKIFKSPSIFIIFSAILFVVFPIANATAVTGSFSVSFGLLDYGFLSTRNQASKSIDSITIPQINSSINFTTPKGYKFTMGYSYDYILQSITYGGISIIRRNFEVGTGLSIGFYNKLPLQLIPGTFGLIKVKPLKSLKISVYGYSSIFLKRLFSLESVTNDFDQNVLNMALYYETDYVDVGIRYNSRNLYKLISSGHINNSLSDYQFTIQTQLENSVINSDTTLGGSDSIYKTPSANNRLIQIYIDETLFISIKSFELNIGSRINILSFTLKDIKSISPPKLPYFNLHTGFNYKFGK